MLGVGIPPLHGEADAAYYAGARAKLQPAWWYDWRHGQIGADGYVPMLYDASVLDSAMAARDETNLWLLFNEPERTGQANMTPQTAAAVYRTFLHNYMGATAVGGVNVSAHVGDAPYQWLDTFLGCLGRNDRNRITYWHIHIYGAVVAFCEALGDFKIWMHTNRVTRPIIVSECGTDDNPGALMQAIEFMLGGSELHSAAWFSAYYEPWNNTGLLDAEGELTEIGEALTAERHALYAPVVMA